MNAYVAVVMTGSFGVGIADSDHKGFTPYIDGFSTEAEAQAAAQELNDEIGVSKLDATAVKICSMFRPGEYDEVRATI